MSTTQAVRPSASAVAEKFRQMFGAQPRLFRAPGRVNLIGEHTDYNDGFVMPAAIAFHTVIAGAPRSDSKLAVCSLDFGESYEYDLRDPHPARAGGWADYVRGVAVQLMAGGYRVGGANLLIRGDVPIGAGLSSSASIEVATALGLTSLAGLELDRVQLAKICQRAENEFVGARCGIMDQFVSANGRAGHALLLDCRSLQFDSLVLPPGISIVICNTTVKHQIAGGEYNQRRAQCEEGVRLLQRALPRIRALRDVSAAELAANKHLLPTLLYKRCLHVVSENDRLLRAAEALRRSDLDAIALCMAESHRSLRDDYEVSCAELDAMVELANGQPGVIGARMTGGGFGGCTVNLVRADAVEQFRSAVSRGYAQRTGITPEIYVSPAAEGASEVRTTET